VQGMPEIKDRDQLVIVMRKKGRHFDDHRLVMRTAVVGDPNGAIEVPYRAYPGKKIIFHR
jgi:hypothetical protein